ncbi:MAG TPA: cysteine-rich CWC family protein [Steroidobacteraceae bacterium]|jgi:hypothetical protein|nr:cysteine-rich CWC family protein [Steroidobacteraceae bacterium]
MAPAAERCPRCGQPNRCAVAAGSDAQRRCWCMDQSFPAALPQGGGPACLCQACVQQLAALG